MWLFVHSTISFLWRKSHVLMGSSKYMDNIPHMLYEEETFVCPVTQKNGEMFSCQGNEIVLTSLDVLGYSTPIPSGYKMAGT